MGTSGKPWRRGEERRGRRRREARGYLALDAPRGCCGAAVRTIVHRAFESSRAPRPNEGQEPHEPAAELVAAGSAARTFNRVYLSALCANSLCERQRVFPQDALLTERADVDGTTRPVMYHVPYP